MAREIVMEVWCDPCLANEQKEPAFTPEKPVQVTVGGKAYELDLCEVHFKELLAPAAEAVLEWGIKVDPTKVGAGRPSRVDQVVRTGGVLCAICGNTYKNDSSFNAHVRQQHGLLIREYRAQHEGAATPSPASQDTAGPVSEATCDLCGKTYSHALGNNRPAQALGVHKAQKHGIRSPARQVT